MLETGDITSMPFGRLEGVTDNPNTLISIVRFDGNNFLSWFYSAQIYITGKGKLGYLTGATKVLAPSSPNFPKWVAESAIVMS